MCFYYVILAELHIEFKHYFVYDTLTSKIEERPFHIPNYKQILPYSFNIEVMHLDFIGHQNAPKYLLKMSISHMSP